MVGRFAPRQNLEQTLSVSTYSRETCGDFIYGFMAMCSSFQLGGYDNDFCDVPPESLTCPICLLLLRCPHILSCCGAKYCEPCIGRVKAAGQPCPLCKQHFDSFIDKTTERKVLEMKTRCSRKNDGCEWEGQLRHLTKHEMDECEWALVECRYSCGERVSRRLLAEHEQDACEQRPMNVKLESIARKMEQRHKTEMATVRGDREEAS